MYQESSIIERHARRTLDEVISPAVWGPGAPVEIAVAVLPGEPEPFDQAVARDFAPISVGAAWGRPWSTWWFHVTGSVPAEFAGHNVDLFVDLGFHRGLVGFHAEGLVCGPDGQVRGGIHPERRTSAVARPARGGEPIDLYIEAAANPLVIGHLPTPMGDPATLPEAELYRLIAVDLRVRRDDVAALADKLRFVLNLTHNVAKDGPLRPRYFRAIERTMAVLDARDVEGSAAAACVPLDEVLSEPGAPGRHLATAIGHAHIDTAWLWPLRETRRKCARTFANQLDLMDRFPQHRFGASQAAQYEMVERDHPDLFAKIRERVAEGRWAVLGGCWVEADGNLPGGESLVRQHLYGQQYFAERFGSMATVGWIPDVFGYPASLPQIMRLAGLEYFVTQKLSWNRTNTFPHHTFVWEGLDGSAILTHFPPTDTYNCEINPYELGRADRHFADHGWSRRSLVVFGHGDGGGGPTEAMLDRLDFAADTNGLPQLELGTPAAFFHDVADEVERAESELPGTVGRWRGELYFEMHRGTYTSQAKTKAGNRRAELLLRQAEWLAAAAWGTGERYPAQRLTDLWRRTLTLQFHDILPGSSIAWVHQEAEAEFAVIAAEVEAMIAEALESLGTDGVFNPAPHARDAVVVLPAHDVGPVELTHQPLGDDAAVWVQCPAGGGGRIVQPPPSVEPVTVEATTAGGRMGNGLVEVAWDDTGQLTSIEHVAAGRSVLRPGGSGNRLELYEDRPIEYDAWDIEPYYRHHRTVLDRPVSITVTEVGPLVGRVRIEHQWTAGSIIQTLEMRAGSERIDVHCEVDWRESETMLKVAFDVDVATDHSSAEVQFGHVRRQLAVNTTWDLARFEISAHRWLDLSEPDWGVAVLNDSKYGYDTLDGCVRLTLLRSANYPDPQGDRGQHRFTYSVLPHHGDLAHSEVIAEGYRLNLPVRPGGGSVTAPAVSDHPGVVVEAVKAAEDGSGDLIVRLYESRGAASTAHVRFSSRPRDVVAVDLLERPFPAGEPAFPVAVPSLSHPDVSLKDDVATVSVKPFQIVTLRVRSPAP